MEKVWIDGNGVEAAKITRVQSGFWNKEIYTLIVKSGAIKHEENFHTYEEAYKRMRELRYDKY